MSITISTPVPLIFCHKNFNARGFDLLTGLVTDGPAGFIMGGRENKAHFCMALEGQLFGISNKN